MFFNADFSRPAVLTAENYQWVPSPQGGVERVMLDRIGAEKARATSVVRYAANSHFPRHHHPGGEEIFVLSGTFSEEGGNYPAGWYLRNPPGSCHQPSSEHGAVIFVKLFQMREDDTRHVRVDTRKPEAWISHGSRHSLALYADEHETVTLERIPPKTALELPSDGGVELFVLEGALWLESEMFLRGGWMRLPVDELRSVLTGTEGATVYKKTGHLREAGMRAR